MALFWKSLALLLLIITVARGDEFAWFDACTEGDVGTVSSILSGGSMDVNYPDENGLTPMILAATHGHVGILNALLDAGADIELAANYPAQVDTPLSAAAHHAQRGAAEVLLARGALVDGRGRDGRTALMTAAAQGHLGVVAFLEEQGAALDLVKVDGTSALFWAAHGGHADVVAHLLAATQTKTEENKEEGEEEEEEEEEEESAAAVDVARRDFFDGSQPIHFAVQVAHGDDGERTRRVLAQLVTFGADPDARTGVVGPRLADGTPKENPEREELQGGRTPLMIAAAHGNLPALEFLLGMIQGTSSAQSKSPPPQGRGVDVNAQDVQGASAAHAAAALGKHRALGLLLLKGKAQSDQSAALLTGLPDAEAKAPLHVAAMGGHFECVRKLLKAGAKVDQRSALTNGVGPGQTPLLLASHEGHTKVMKLLLKAGADPNAAAKDGATPLIAAAASGQRGAVKLLLRRGADPRFKLRESGEQAVHLTSDRKVGKLLYEAEYWLRRAEAEGAGGGVEEEDDEGDEVDLDDLGLDEEDEEDEDGEDEEDEEDEDGDEEDEASAKAWGAENAESRYQSWGEL